MPITLQFKPEIKKMDTEHKLMAMIRGFSLYQSKDKASFDDQILKPCVDRVFRTICSMGEEKEIPADMGTKNLRVK